MYDCLSQKIAVLICFDVVYVGLNINIKLWVKLD